MLLTLPASQIQNRPIFIDQIVSEEIAAELQERGYELVDVRAMPIDTPEEHRDNIAGWMQGAAEGTIVPSQERRRSFSLQADLHGLKSRETKSVALKIDASALSTREILQMLNSSRTLQNTTVQQEAKARAAGLDPSVKLEVVAGGKE